MKKMLFIYNPSSGYHYIKDSLDWIIGEFKKNNIWCIPYRLDDFNKRKLLASIKEINIDSIVIAGGDGSLNYIINILLKNNIDIPIGVIPAGTCNDFAACLGIESNFKKAVGIINEHNIKQMDVGLLNNKKYFLSTCAGGNIVDVSLNTPNDFKKNFGRFAYYLNAMASIKNIKPFSVEIKTDTETFLVDAMMFIVLNGKQGGGLSNLIQGTDLCDGLMDIAILKKSSTIDLANVLFQVVAGEVINNKSVKIVKTSKCSIKSIGEDKTPIKSTIDGEKGPELPINIEFLKKKLKFFVPK